MNRQKYIDALKLKMPYFDENTLQQIVNNNLINAMSEIEYQEKLEQTNDAITIIIKNISNSISDFEANNITLLFPKWQKGVHYKQGDIVNYNGQLWRIGKGTIN